MSNFDNIHESFSETIARAEKEAAARPEPEGTRWWEGTEAEKGWNKMTIEELQVETERLNKLLKDQHPGLMTWCEVLERTIRRIHELTGDWMDENNPPAPRLSHPSEVFKHQLRKR